MLDLLALAKRNRLTDLANKEDETNLPFMSWAESNRMASTNLSPGRITDTLERGQFENIHEWLKRTHSTDEANAKYANHDWLKKRVAFEGHCFGGSSFFYAALNLGDDGLTKYGIYCYLFPFGEVGPDWVALGGDSLRDYWDEVASKPRLDAIIEDVRPGDQAIVVLIRALVKRKEPLIMSAHVCHSKFWYVELISPVSPVLQSSHAVRMSKLVQSRLLRGSRASAPIELRAAYEQYLKIRGLLKARGISMVVSDA